LVLAATTSPPKTKTRSSTRTTTALATHVSGVGGLFFNVCFSQLDPKPPSGGQTKRIRRIKEKKKVLNSGIKNNELDKNNEGEQLSLDLPNGPAGRSRAAGSQVGLYRLSRRGEACDLLSAQPLSSRAGMAPTRDDQTGSAQSWKESCC
jgi:hypothetical protein